MSACHVCQPACMCVCTCVFVSMIDLEEGGSVGGERDEEPPLLTRPSPPPGKERLASHPPPAPSFLLPSSLLCCVSSFFFFTCFYPLLTCFLLFFLIFLFFHPLFFTPLSSPPLSSPVFPAPCLMFFLSFPPIFSSPLHSSCIVLFPLLFSHSITSPSVPLLAPLSSSLLYLLSYRTLPVSASADLLVRRPTLIFPFPFILCSLSSTLNNAFPQQSFAAAKVFCMKRRVKREEGRHMSEEKKSWDSNVRLKAL